MAHDAGADGATVTLWAWRHPRPHGVAGRCMGRTDVPVDARRAKRLARRIQRAARQHGLPRVVCSSPLQRCADVARWLRRWGWVWHRDPALLEMDFGRWDGQPWPQIGRAEVDAWCADFAQHAPGGGEALAAMLARAAAWTPPAGAAPTVVLVAHAGWMLARRWAASGAAAPTQAADWPAAPPYGACWTLR
jgi:alpha-ribazole phosphatase